MFCPKSSLRICFILAFVAFYPVSSIFAGSLWGGDFSGKVYEIDPQTGERKTRFEFQFRGPVPREIQDLTFDPLSKRVVGVTGGKLYDSPVTFFQFDPFASVIVPEILGVYSPTQPGTVAVNGLAYDHTGSLFLSEWNSLDDKLVQLDLATLSPLKVFDLPSPANFNIGDLETGITTNEVFAIHASNQTLFSIATPDGPLKTVGSFEQSGFTNAMAYDFENNRFYLSDTRLVEFDPISGDTIRVVSQDNYYALTYVAVPEASTLVLTSMGCLGILFGRCSRIRTGRRSGD